MTHSANGATRRFAIVGAGPAGFYTAEALATACPDCEIDLIDRLPTPYGLVRSGVAPDHQATKKIQETFDSIAGLPNVRFVGHVEIGRDVSLAELRDMYDAVVLASGAPYDVALDIPGAGLPGVYGAAAFVGWYNAHPEYAGLNPQLDRTGAVVIGNGNVAIDIARILSRPAADLAASDIADYALQQLRGSHIADVHIVGRRGALDAKFTTVELRELGELHDVVALAEPAQIPAALDDNLPPRERRLKAKNLECFQAFAKEEATSRPRRIRFQFNARPVEILGETRVEAIRFERTQVENGRVVGSGETFDVPCGLVVAAIGYQARSIGDLPVAAAGNRLENVDGLIAPGLYVVGWLKRGPSGKIGTNRLDGEEIAERIRAEVGAHGKPGFQALQQMLDQRQVRWTDFADWKNIERAEAIAALDGAPRRKFFAIPEMLKHRVKPDGYTAAE